MTFLDIALSRVGRNMRPSVCHPPGLAPACRHPRMASALASNCVAGFDCYLFVFILAPLYPPRPFPAPPGGKGELTPLFGRVLKQRKYTCQGTLNSQNNFEIRNSDFGIGCPGLHAVEAVLSSAAAGGSGRSLFERSEFSPTLSGFLGSDPNSGLGLRANQQSSTDLGSDPNNTPEQR